MKLKLRQGRLMFQHLLVRRLCRACQSRRHARDYFSRKDRFFASDPVSIINNASAISSAVRTVTDTFIPFLGNETNRELSLR